MPQLPPPSPARLLRSHSTQLSALWVSGDNERIYSGDVSGFAVITSTRSLRAISSWKAHTDGLLGVQEWEKNIITHGRDNKLHVWAPMEEPSINLGSSAALLGLPTPTLLYSMDVNAMNYCRFSLMPLTSPIAHEKALGGETEALLAIPNLIESSLADIWSLPSRQRLHAAIGKVKTGPSSDGRGAYGIIMSVHLFSVATASHASSSTVRANDLRLLCAYENGGVTLWRFTRTDKLTSVEGLGWEAMWHVKLHNESVMAMAVSRNAKLAMTVSADHLIGRYDLTPTEQPDFSPQSAFTVHRTKHPGNSAIVIRDDGKVCAVGGWDGKIRLYSTKSLKSLGTLDYHKNGCQTLAFATPLPSNEGTRNDEDEDDMTEDEKLTRSRWLVAGGKDSRVSIWELMSFEKA